MKGRKYEQYCDNPGALKSLDTAQLQALWAAIFKGRRRPQSNDIIISQIAYFLQEQKHGGLSIRSQNQLSRLIEGKAQNPLNKYTLDHSQQLIREWNGRKYHVAVLGKDKFQYNGKVYKTLSAIAKEITGAHWSGPLFFGLRKQVNGQRG
jgi:hypothetical protein